MRFQRKPNKKMHLIIILIVSFISLICATTIRFEYDFTVSNQEKYLNVSAPIQRDMLLLAFEVSIPRTFWERSESKVCVEISHENGYVHSCHSIYENTKNQSVHVHGVTGPISIISQVKHEDASLRSEERKLSLYLYDLDGKSQGTLKDEALFHPESGSLPLVYTGDLKSTMDIVPKRLSVSMLSQGGGDSVNSYHFSSVGFDAEKSEIYLIERNNTNINTEIPKGDVVTTTHRRHVQALNEGWNRSTTEKGKKEQPLWSINTGIRIKHVPHDFLHQLHEHATLVQKSGNYTLEENETKVSTPIRIGGGYCVAVPTFIVSMPLPLFYWHTVAEGVFPLAHAIRKMQERLKIDDISPLIVLTQGWSDRLVPRFLAHMLQGLTAWPIIDMDTLIYEQRKNGPLCFFDLTVGYYPQISNPTDFRHGTEWMIRRFKADLTDRELQVAKSSPPVVTFVQRKNRCAASDTKWLKENHTISTNGTGRNNAARSIENLKDLTHEAMEMGSVVEVVYLEGMGVRDQMQTFRRADVIVAAHGSAWANTAFMRDDTAAIQVYGFGVKESCVSLMNMYRHTFEAMDDLCNGVLIDFPSVVPGYYKEIREENKSAHIAIFEFEDEYCT